MPIFGNIAAAVSSTSSVSLRRPVVSMDGSWIALFVTHVFLPSVFFWNVLLRVNIVLIAFVVVVCRFVLEDDDEANPKRADDADDEEEGTEEELIVALIISIIV